MSGSRRSGGGSRGSGSGRGGEREVERMLEAWAPVVIGILLVGALATFANRQWPTVQAKAHHATASVHTWVDGLRGSSGPQVPDLDKARDIANGLPVHAPVTVGYKRAAFGPRWADVDHNGCDTRDDILARDLDKVTRRGACVVIGGILHDPYTGRTIVFRKAKASAIQIDHIVPLSEAWQSGAGRWSAARRLALANDPLNLLAVDGPTNESKGDKDPARWLPATDPCTYLRRYVAVKTGYHLSVDPAEGLAITRKLLTC